MNQKPTSLENLPEYLKSVRKNGNTGSLLVNTGQIVEPKRSSWIKTMAFAASIVFLSAGTFFAYDSMSTKEYTVLVDMDKDANSLKSIAKIVSDNGGQILSVQQKEDTVYEVKVETRNSRRSFLDWFRKNRDVKKAEMEN